MPYLSIRIQKIERPKVSLVAEVPEGTLMKMIGNIGSHEGKQKRNAGLIWLFAKQVISSLRHILKNRDFFF
jgi:hypothetical protein